MFDFWRPRHVANPFAAAPAAGESLHSAILFLMGKYILKILIFIQTQLEMISQSAKR